MQALPFEEYILRRVIPLDYLRLVLESLIFFFLHFGFFSVARRDRVFNESFRLLTSRRDLPRCCLDIISLSGSNT